MALSYEKKQDDEMLEKIDKIIARAERRGHTLYMIGAQL